MKNDECDHNGVYCECQHDELVAELDAARECIKLMKIRLSKAVPNWAPEIRHVIENYDEVVKR